MMIIIHSLIPLTSLFFPLFPLSFPPFSFLVPGNPALPCSGPAQAEQKKLTNFMSFHLWYDTHTCLLQGKTTHHSVAKTIPPECVQVVRACCPLLSTKCPSCPQPRRKAGRQQMPGMRRCRCHPATVTTPMLPPLLLSTSSRRPTTNSRLVPPP